MGKYINLVIVSLIFLAGCEGGFRKSNFKYDYNKLISAWAQNDSSYVRDWIYNLEDLDFTSFANRVSEFANETNFSYGNIDIEGDINSRWNEKERRILKGNITRVYRVYIESCLFFNKAITRDSTDNISNKYWNDSTLFSSDGIAKIKLELNAFCLRK
ncbi:MAG: hypothetical protein CFE21_14935 [Bacteroidetes bacterium B1(2017)]|nr:MAG: hypothetical protein CFE21_14935 [Bacteroidetes bacterium B1(2017)]